MKFPDNINLGICIPSNGSWKSAFGRSVSMLCADFTVWKQPGIKSKTLQLFNYESSMLPKSRQELVHRALKAGCTHILFLDSDMAFPKNIAKIMLSRDKDIVMANCTTRQFPVTQIAIDLKGKPLDSRGKRGIQRARQVGLAVALIRAEVFKKLTPPLFMMEWIPELNDHCGEDIYFTQLAQEAGFEVWVDHDASQEVYHVGDFIYGYKHIELNDVIQDVCNTKL